MAALSGHNGVGQAGHCHPMAPSGLPHVLAYIKGTGRFSVGLQLCVDLTSNAVALLQAPVDIRTWPLLRMASAARQLRGRRGQPDASSPPAFVIPDSRRALSVTDVLRFALLDEDRGDAGAVGVPGFPAKSDL
jgi:hypothetical protein